MVAAMFKSYVCCTLATLDCGSQCQRLPCHDRPLPSLTLCDSLLLALSHAHTATHTHTAMPPCLLRSLVFHTYLPKQGASSASSAEASASFDDAPPLLAEYAPLLLRSLYERDVR